MNPLKRGIKKVGYACVSKPSPERSRHGVKEGRRRIIDEEDGYAKGVP